MNSANKSELFIATKSLSKFSLQSFTGSGSPGIFLQTHSLVKIQLRI